MWLFFEHLEDGWMCWADVPQGWRVYIAQGWVYYEHLLSGWIQWECPQDPVVRDKNRLIRILQCEVDELTDDVDRLEAELRWLRLVTAEQLELYQEHVLEKNKEIEELRTQIRCHRD